MSNNTLNIKYLLANIYIKLILNNFEYILNILNIKYIFALHKTQNHYNNNLKEVRECIIYFFCSKNYKIKMRYVETALYLKLMLTIKNTENNPYSNNLHHFLLSDPITNFRG